MNRQQAERRAAEHTRVTHGRAFVCEHNDDAEDSGRIREGRFCVVPEIEYYADPDEGEWFREAVAEYFNGELVSQN